MQRLRAARLCCSAVFRPAGARAVPACNIEAAGGSTVTRDLTRRSSALMMVGAGADVSLIDRDVLALTLRRRLGERGLSVCTVNVGFARILGRRSARSGGSLPLAPLLAQAGLSLLGEARVLAAFDISGPVTQAGCRFSPTPRTIRIRRGTSQ